MKDSLTPSVHAAPPGEPGRLPVPAELLYASPPVFPLITERLGFLRFFAICMAALGWLAVVGGAGLLVAGLRNLSADEASAYLISGALGMAGSLVFFALENILRMLRGMGLALCDLARGGGSGGGPEEGDRTEGRGRAHPPSRR
jgi:hypothetical protein